MGYQKVRIVVKCMIMRIYGAGAIGVGGIMIEVLAKASSQWDRIHIESRNAK